jgi:hypothetical protein
MNFLQRSECVCFFFYIQFTQDLLNLLKNSTKNTNATCFNEVSTITKIESLFSLHSQLWKTLKKITFSLTNWVSWCFILWAVNDVQGVDFDVFKMPSKIQRYWNQMFFSLLFSSNVSFALWCHDYCIALNILRQLTERSRQLTTKTMRWEWDHF